jgi:hypothetical protein
VEPDAFRTNTVGFGGRVSMLESKRGMKKMLIVFGALLGAIVAAVIFVLADWFIFSRAEPEIHLIPDGYVGPVVIAFDRDDGTPKKYEDRTRVYEIPADGILKTKFPRNDGTHHSWKFYYVKADGTKHDLPYFLDLREVPIEGRNTVAIYSMGSVSAPSNRVKHDMSFFTYVVGKVSDNKSLITKQHNIDLNDL